MIICDKTTFEDEVLKAEGVVLVDFFGDGCAPCAALMPHIEELSRKYGDKIKFCKLNTSAARRTCHRTKDYGVAGHRHLQGRRKGRRTNQR